MYEIASYQRPKWIIVLKIQFKNFFELFLKFYAYILAESLAKSGKFQFNMQGQPIYSFLWYHRFIFMSVRVLLLKKV